MKLIPKIIWALISLMLFVLPAGALEREKATVSILFVNNGQTPFDNILNEHISKFLQTKVDGLYHVAKLDTASRPQGSLAEIITQYGGKSAGDYLIYLELSPLERKEHVAVFRYGKNIAVVMRLAIVNLCSGQVLYDEMVATKAGEDAATGFLDCTIAAWINIRSQYVGLKAIDKALFRVGEAISVKLPLQPAGCR